MISHELSPHSKITVDLPVGADAHSGRELLRLTLFSAAPSFY
jgi:hypothetical protein